MLPSKPNLVRLRYPVMVPTSLSSVIMSTLVIVDALGILMPAWKLLVALVSRYQPQLEYMSWLRPSLENEAAGT